MKFIWFNNVCHFIGIQLKGVIKSIVHPHLTISFILLNIWSKCLYPHLVLYIFLPCIHIVHLIPTLSIFLGPSWWSWSYGSWIYNYLCNQCLSPLMLWVQIPLRRGVLNTTLYDKSCQWQVGGFLYVLRVPPPIKLTTLIYLKYC